MAKTTTGYTSKVKQICFLLFLFTTVICDAQNMASWSQMGPVKFPANPSVQTTGMGRVSCLVYHPTDSNTLFAVSASGGVYKTSNECISWKPISDFLPPTSCASLAINPKNANEMYLGTGDANYNSSGLGIWKTTNGGKTWVQSTSGIGNKLVSKILIDPSGSSTLFAACSDGIYKSINSGSTWVKKSTISASYRDLCFKFKSNTVLYASTNSNFYVSFDAGEHWVQRTISSTIPASGVQIGITPADTSVIYCVIWKTTASNNSCFALFKSVNNGSTFTLQSETPNILGYSSTGSTVDGQGSYNLAIAVDKTNANTVYVGGITVWKSTDGGINWTLSSPWAFGVHADKHGFLFSPFNNNKLFIYHDGGLDLTTDGGSNWHTLEDGLTASEFYKMGASNFKRDVVIGGLQDNGLDVSSGNTFYTIQGGDYSKDFEADKMDSNYIYYNGNTVRRNMYTFSNSTINGSGIYLTHPSDTNILFYAGAEIFRSTNARTNPTANITFSQITNTSSTNNIVDYAMTKKSKGIMYYANGTAGIYRSDNVNATTPTFSLVSTLPSSTIKQIVTIDNDSNLVYVILSNNLIYRSVDKGLTWASVTKSNLPSSVSIIKFLPDQKATDSSMYVAMYNAVYYRNRYMASWLLISQKLPTVAQISDFEIMSDGSENSRLFVSTYGRGIWQSDLYKPVYDKPIALFAVQPSSNQSCPNTFILVDNSIGNPLTRRWQIYPDSGWQFINETDSSSSRAEVRFSSAANYYISLIVTNTKGSATKNTLLAFPNVNSANCGTTTTNVGSYTIGINRFEFNTINNISSTNTGTSASNEDFSCKVSTIVKAGVTYTAWVTNGSSYNENCKIYIDYNNNGQFTDANEMVGTISSGKGRRSCNISILSSPPVVNKYLRMRVVSDYSAVTAPCGTLSYGESEDYSLMIDNIKPAITIQIPKPTVSKAFTAIFKTSEVVNNFDSTDIIAVNATISRFKRIDLLNYSALITPLNNAMVSLKINSNHITDLAGNSNNTVSDSTRCFVGFNLFTFKNISIKDSIIQTINGGSIFCYVPYGTAKSTLKSHFVLSDSCKAYITTYLQISDTTVNDFTSSIVYTIKSVDNLITKTYTVNVITLKNTECLLLTYSILSPSATGVINQITSGGTVNVNLPFGTSLNNLTALFTVSDNATVTLSNIKQISGITNNNFTTQLTYKITAEDSNYVKTYLVSVVAVKNTECKLLTYNFVSPAVSGTINQLAGGGTILLVVPYGTSLNGLLAAFTLSDSAKAFIKNVQQISGSTANNFSTVVTYKIVAQDTNYKKFYDVTVQIAANTACNLISYNIVNPAVAATITTNANGNFADIYVPFGTGIKNLTGSFTLSDSAKATVSGLPQISGITVNDFSDTVFFLVNAQSHTDFKLYKIKVHILPNPQCDLISYKFITPNVTGIINPTAGGGTVDLLVPANTNLQNLIAGFVLSDSASAFVNNVEQFSNITANDFTNPVTYITHSQNNINTKTYIVTVSKQSGINDFLKNELAIFPNPFTESIQIQNLEYSGNEAKTIIFMDVNGKVIKTISCKSKNYTLQFDRIPAGVYYLVVDKQVFTLIKK